MAMSEKAVAVGIGLPTRNKNGKTLEVFYPFLAYQPAAEIVRAIGAATGHKGGNSSYVLSKSQLDQIASSLKSDPKQSELITRVSRSDKVVIATIIEEDTLPGSTEEAYLKLSLISNQLVKPRILNIENIFDILPNIAWTSDGPMDIEEARDRLIQSRLDGFAFHVLSIDKFPKLFDYCLPEQVRVADGARVRLGAYLGPGTTVMQTGMVNFNAGTEGPNMVEGRVSVGVFIGGNSDLGGGSSTMSSIHRDNTKNITIGRDCVVGANAGAGIPLGDECTIEAGLYVTAGTKVELLDRTNRRVGTVKARDLGGKSNLLFRRNSSTGQVEALESDATVQLNKALHVNR